jgi:hypothetical protein
MPVADSSPPDMRLTCQECDAVADDDAFRWRALLAVDPDDAFAEPLLAFYCPACAEKEFGPSLRMESRRSSPS